MNQKRRWSMPSAALVRIACRQLWCWVWYRHAPTIHMTEGRLWVRCEVCLYESPGVSWVLAPLAPSSAKVLRFQKRLRARSCQGY